MEAEARLAPKRAARKAELEEADSFMKELKKA
jgi:hypothetical protein